MRIVVNVDAKAVGGPRAVATIARGFLRGVILQNRILIRRRLVPSLYGAFMRGELRFAPEPWAGRFEEFADAVTVARRGWGDCDDLVCWRCAEWQELKGINAQPKIYWRLFDESGRQLPPSADWRDAARIGYHAEVRVPCTCHRPNDPRRLSCDGSFVEDVSTFLGMARRATRQGTWADRDRVA